MWCDGLDCILSLVDLDKDYFWAIFMKGFTVLVMHAGLKSSLKRSGDITKRNCKSADFLAIPSPREIVNPILNGMGHSAAMVNLTKLQKTLMVPVQGERVYLKDSKCILFEILANRTWKGYTSSCQPSQPNCKIWLAQPAGTSTALPCPIC